MEFATPQDSTIQQGATVHPRPIQYDQFQHVFTNNLKNYSTVPCPTLEFHPLLSGWSTSVRDGHEVTVPPMEGGLPTKPYHLITAALHAHHREHITSMASLSLSSMVGVLGFENRSMDVRRVRLAPHSHMGALGYRCL